MHICNVLMTRGFQDMCGGRSELSSEQQELLTSAARCLGVPVFHVAACKPLAAAVPYTAIAFASCFGIDLDSPCTCYLYDEASAGHVAELQLLGCRLELLSAVLRDAGMLRRLGSMTQLSQRAMKPRFLNMSELQTGTALSSMLRNESHAEGEIWKQLALIAEPSAKTSAFQIGHVTDDERCVPHMFRRISTGERDKAATLSSLRESQSLYGADTQPAEEDISITVADVNMILIDHGLIARSQATRVHVADVVRDSEGVTTARVKGSGSESYVVAVDVMATKNDRDDAIRSCTCMAFQNARDKRCKHIGGLLYSLCTDVSTLDSADTRKRTHKSPRTAPARRAQPAAGPPPGPPNPPAPPADALHVPVSRSRLVSSQSVGDRQQCDVSPRKLPVSLLAQTGKRTHADKEKGRGSSKRTARDSAVAMLTVPRLRELCQMCARGGYDLLGLPAHVFEDLSSEFAAARTRTCSRQNSGQDTSAQRQHQHDAGPARVQPSDGLQHADREPLTRTQSRNNDVTENIPVPAPAPVSAAGSTSGTPRDEAAVHAVHAVLSKESSLQSPALFDSAPPSLSARESRPEQVLSQPESSQDVIASSESQHYFKSFYDF